MGRALGAPHRDTVEEIAQAVEGRTEGEEWEWVCVGQRGAGSGIAMEKGGAPVSFRFGREGVTMAFTLEMEMIIK
jgi:hypothetical protein